MHVEDLKQDLQMGKRVGYTVLVIVGIMLGLIVISNLIA